MDRVGAVLGHGDHGPEGRAAIAAIPEAAWTAIRYPRDLGRPAPLPGVRRQGRRVEYTAFTSKKGQAITAQLIVRRVRYLNKQAAAGQEEPFPPGATTRYSSTPCSSWSGPRNSTVTTRSSSRSSLTAPAARWRACGPGSSPANAAWLACAVITHDLLRAAGSLASLAYGKARGVTIRRDLIDVAARTARHGHGHITLHLPEARHCGHEWTTLFTATCCPPLPAA